MSALTPTAKARAAMEARGKFAAWEVPMRACADGDVRIEIKYAGICHSDIHQAREEWGKAIFPMVPGHEVAGHVTAVGPGVTKFKVGDKIGVGCMVDSCRSCKPCKAGEEQYCKTGMVGTYNGRYKYPHCPGYNAVPELCQPTYGGYAQGMVVHQDYCCTIPDSLPFEKVAPLLCAGITVFSPMQHYGMKATDNVAVCGLGGLGHMAVKIAKAWGCRVTVLSRGTKKKEECLKNLGADAFIDTTNAEEVAAAAETFDFMINTIAAEYDMGLYLGMVGTNGKMAIVGAPGQPLPVAMFGLILRRKTICGSLIGGIKETQDMLDFCGKHNITPDVEMINADQIDEAYDRAVASDVKYRFVIDCATI